MRQNNTEMNYWGKTPMGAKVHRPRIKVSFHTEKACYHAMAGAKNAYGEPLDPNNQILSVGTQKDIDSVAGSFNMMLAGTQWMTYLSPNDLVVVQMGYVGEKTLTTAFAGFIDDVRRSRTVDGEGKPQVSTSVVGRDFGKPLLETMLKFYPEIGMKSGKEEKFFLTDAGWLSLMKFFTNDQVAKGTPAVIIDNIMRHILQRLNDVEWVAYNEMGPKPAAKKVTLANMIRYQLAKVDFFLPMMLTADEFEGPVWNLMERAALKPFVELWVDVRSEHEAWNPSVKGRAVPDLTEETSNQNKAKLSEGAYPFPAFQFGEDGAKVLLCMRETPFDSKHKERLVRHELDEADILSEDLGKSDSEHYNLFWAGTTVNPLGIDLKRVSPPLLNEANAKKFGLKPLEVQVEGLEILQSKSSDHAKKLEGLSGKYSAKLKAWFENNHRYLNGQLTIRGNANIRVGHMVNYRAPSFNYEFYVEGVQHTYNVFEGWTTTLTVTRGMRISEKVDHETYTPKPPEPPKKAAPKPADSYHTVRRGDTLWALAGKHYGDNQQWRKIWEANRTMMIARDPRNATMHGHWIFPGQKLRIPPK